MQTLFGFDVRERLYSRGNTTVLRVRREQDGLGGVLKFFDTDARAHSELERIKNECNCLKAIESPHVIRVHDLVFFDRGVGILMEDFPGESLASILQRRTRLDVRTFLEVATRLTAGVRDIHRQKVIHQDLKPSNVLMDEASGALRIIDFGISGAFSVMPAGDRLGSLPYMSPEQTGKMNRSVDLRSDLYSLGVMFYELLVGQPPFVSQDPLELVHAHIAKLPEAPSEREIAVPRFLSAVIMKLLSKEAELRYQSATGLLSDLEACFDYAERGRPIPDDLAVGTRDQQQVFRIPEKLYGRERELARLSATFERASAGAFQAVLVSGYSGIGKSALIREVHKPLVAARGFFTSGKYDAVNKAQPYGAIQQAITELVRSVLRLPEDEVQEWRGALLEALGDEGQCLIDIVPLLETLTGPQRTLADPGPVARRNRFERRCGALLRVFANAEHPLVLVLDDAQWADAASLELMRSWIEAEIPYLMLVLAYRDNEVGPSHPLSLVLGACFGSALERHRIRLAHIERRDVEQLVADTLGREPEEVRGLAAMLETKTGGNPFFLIQMFRGLYEDGLITFGPEGWSWDTEQLATRDFSDNVVALMTDKLQRYGAATMDALNMGAVLGDGFALSTLAVVLDQGPATTYRAVLPAIEDGLLVESNGRLRFAHDRVLEASYGLVGEQVRTERHRRVGRHLLTTLEDDALDAQLFKIVQDLNRSRDLIEDRCELLKLSRLNIRAGRRALASSAFEPAVGLFAQAAKLLPEDAWATATELAFDAYFGLASADYACSRYGECEETLEVCLQQVKDPVRNAPAVQLLLNALFGQNRHADSVRVGLERLAALGVELSPRPTKAEVFAAYVKLKVRQGRRPTATLADLPPATDRRAIAALGILNDLLPPAYLINSDLYGLIAMTMAQLSLKYGNTPFSPLGYATTMATEMGILKAIESGAAYMRLAEAVSERYPNAQQRGRVDLMRTCVALHHLESLQDCEKQVMACVAHNIDIGALNFADYTLALTRMQSLFFGRRSFDEVFESNRAVLELHRKHGDREVIGNQVFLLHTLDRWRCAGSFPEADVDPEVRDFDRDAYARKLSELASLMPRSYWTVCEQLERYLSGDPVDSLRLGLAFSTKSPDLFGVMTDHMHRFFYMLAYLAADTDELTPMERAAAAAYYRLNRTIFGSYDRHGPNFRAHLALVEAEEHRRRGRPTQAARAYDRAIEEARAVSLFVEVLACRRLANFQRAQGLDVQALLVARRAWLATRALGFRAELARLEEEFPELSTGYDTRMHGAPGRSSPPTQNETLTGQLDVESMSRGAQAISSQVRFEGLIEALLRQLCQSSAAKRAVLFLQEDGHLSLQGEMRIDERGEELSVLQNIPFPAKRGTEKRVAESIVQLVARLRRTEVIGNAAESSDFADDPYVLERGCKAVLCMPILNQGKLLGILYLENELVADAFTYLHREVLEVLSSQAAISFENARLYRSLEQKVEGRTAELRRKTNDLNSMLQNLEQGVFTILADGTIHHEYSRHLEAILGTRSIAGRDFVDLLFDGASLSSDVIDQVRVAVKFSVGSDALWYESNRHLLIREFERRDADGRPATLALNWSPILTDGELVEKLLVSVRDVTELRQLEQETRAQRRDLEMIGEILALPRAEFLGFVRESERMLDESEAVLDRGSLDVEGLASLMRYMHTVKGNARTYGFGGLARAAHDAEEVYEGCRDTPVGEWDRATFAEALASVRETLQRYASVYRDNLEAFAGAEENTTVVDEALLESIRCAAAAGSPALVQLVEAIGTTELEDLFASLTAGLQDLARQLAKPVPRLVVRARGVRLRQEVVATVRDVWVHLLRNALDHGIEAPDERVRRGKPEVGLIEVSVRQVHGACEIELRDDGRGLDMAFLRRLAQQRSIPADSDAQLAELLFLPGLSTSGAVNDVSGRGVGLDAVRRFLADHGGSVHIDLSTDGSGEFRSFTTRIVLPASCVVVLDQDAEDPTAGQAQPRRGASVG